MWLLMPCDSRSRNLIIITMTTYKEREHLLCFSDQ